MSSGWTLRSKWLPLRVFTEIFIVHETDPFSSLEVRQAVQTARKLPELFFRRPPLPASLTSVCAINQGRKQGRKGFFCAGCLPPNGLQCPRRRPFHTDSTLGLTEHRHEDRSRRAFPLLSRRQTSERVDEGLPTDEMALRRRCFQNVAAHAPTNERNPSVRPSHSPRANGNAAFGVEGFNLM